MEISQNHFSHSPSSSTFKVLLFHSKLVRTTSGIVNWSVIKKGSKENQAVWAANTFLPVHLRRKNHYGTSRSSRRPPIEIDECSYQQDWSGEMERHRTQPQIPCRILLNCTDKIIWTIQISGSNEAIIFQAILEVSNSIKSVGVASSRYLLWNTGHD